MTYLINFCNQIHGLLPGHQILIGSHRLIHVSLFFAGHWPLTTGHCTDPYPFRLSMTRLALPSLRGMDWGSTSFTLTETVK